MTVKRYCPIDTPMLVENATMYGHMIEMVNGPYVLSSDYAALEAQVERLRAACEEFRDVVLNQRDECEEDVFDNDQTNAILSAFDRIVLSPDAEGSSKIGSITGSAEPPHG